jgi:hypothetical protein
MKIPGPAPLAAEFCMGYPEAMLSVGAVLREAIHQACEATIHTVYDDDSVVPVPNSCRSMSCVMSDYCFRYTIAEQI